MLLKQIVNLYIHMWTSQLLNMMQHNTAEKMVSCTQTNEEKSNLCRPQTDASHTVNTHVLLPDFESVKLYSVFKSINNMKEYREYT